MSSDVFVIAEAGVNHNGSLELALQLVREAYNCGADAVKFQTFQADSLLSKSAPMAEYQKKNAKEFSSQYEMIKKLELPRESHRILQEECNRLGIEFMSTPFDLDSAVFLDQLGLNRFKIPSGEICNVPLLRAIAGFKKKTILSTGMSSLDEVEKAVSILTGSGLCLSKITVLHCTTEYPTPMEYVNLLAIQTLKNQIGCEVGYSDHTLGIEVSLAAVALGASVIEKHFTLSREMEGPDHAASLEPNELCTMIKGVRNISLALGDGEKKVVMCEEANLQIARKSIFAKTEIYQGDEFCAENLCLKRPGSGVSPWHWDELIGKKALNSYKPDEMINENEISSTNK